MLESSHQLQKSALFSGIHIIKGLLSQIALQFLATVTVKSRLHAWHYLKLIHLALRTGSSQGSKSLDRGEAQWWAMYRFLVRVDMGQIMKKPVFLEKQLWLCCNFQEFSGTVNRHVFKAGVSNSRSQCYPVMPTGGKHLIHAISLTSQDTVKVNIIPVSFFYSVFRLDKFGQL